MKLFFAKVSLLFSCFSFVSVAAAAPYIYDNQEEGLIEGLDMDASLKVSQVEFDRGGFGADLAIWVLRDQIINADHANTISDMYFNHIEDLSGFGKWHTTWAIANFYRLGNGAVKEGLQVAYEDAKVRANDVGFFSFIANQHVNGDSILMGDIHAGGRFYATTHIVAPGNPEYLQSFEDFGAGFFNQSERFSFFQNTPISAE